MMRRRQLAVTALAFLTGCAHVRLDDAILAHNVYRRVLIEASDAFAPLYGAASSAAMSKPDAEYEAALKPYNGVARALDSGKHAEVAINFALKQCIADNDEQCDLARTGFACAATALEQLWHSYGQIPGGTSLYAVAAVAEQQLRALADGQPCQMVVVKP